MALKKREKLLFLSFSKGQSRSRFLMQYRFLST